eukprot:Gb_02419 [translate_table: standard]
MGRAPCCDKVGVKKGPWSAEEDRKLLAYIHKYGHGNWRALPKQAGLMRCGKSCRLRWTNYLRPDVKRGNFSPEEEQAIIQMHQIVGNKWSTIASYLPGRTDNEIKNMWNTHLKKRLLQMGVDPVTHAPHFSSSPTSPTVTASDCRMFSDSDIEANESGLCFLQLDCDIDSLKSVINNDEPSSVSNNVVKCETDLVADEKLRLESEMALWSATDSSLANEAVSSPNCSHKQISMDDSCSSSTGHVCPESVYEHLFLDLPDNLNMEYIENLQPYSCTLDLQQDDVISYWANLLNQVGPLQRSYD